MELPKMSFEERNLFILGRDITDENVLAVLAALQAFVESQIGKTKAWNKLYKDNRQLVAKTWLVSPKGFADVFKACLPTLVDVYAHVGEVPGDVDFTLVAGLSVDVALRLALGSTKPLALSLGIMIGSEAQPLADVSNLCQEYIASDYVLCDSAFDAILGKEHPDVWRSTISPSVDLATRIKKVFEAKAVIGTSSFETYLACCLKKPVLEVQPSPHLFKWNNPNYFCVTTGNDKDSIRKGIQQCINLVTGE